jgi:peptide/nickel transport system substrate-binding protein
MTRPKRLAVALTAGAVALAVALTGCHSAVNTPKSTDAAPVKGGTLTIAQSADATISTVLKGSLGNQSWAANVLETLTTYDDDMKPQPLLASKWSVSDDKMSMDITLRDGVKFHTGRAMTADDVKFSFEQAADEKSGSQVGYIAKSFKAMDVVSPTELKIEFSQPTPNIFDFLDQTFVIDKETVSGLADGSQVIGTGPFKFVSWSPGSEIKLVRNDDYWGKKPHLDGIDIAIITDSTAMLNAMRSGRSAVAIGMSPVDVRSLSSDSGYSVIVTAGSAMPIGVDVTTAPFDNQQVRQAINYAIDRKRIAKLLFNDESAATDLFWGEDSAAYPKSLKNYYAYDAKKAKQMLKDANAGGAAVTISVINLPQNVSMAEVIRNNLEAVGLKPTIKVMESSEFATAQIDGTLGQAFLPLNGLNGLSPVTLINKVPAIRKNNPSHFWSDEYQSLRQKLLDADNDKAYASALKNLSQYILDQAFSLPVVISPGQTVVSSKVHDLRQSPRGYLYASDAYVTK